MTVRILIGDVRDKLAELPDESVHCCITSPPYWGLRDYGVEGQIGLEADFRDYIATMVEVFRGVRRVLRQDGTLWLNLGDSYAGSWGAEGRRITDSDDPTWHSSQIKNHPKRSASARGYRAGGLKPKDLMLMPARVAIALQEDGWWLRSDIIWAKPNPMPESVTDRPTTSHEHIFLLTRAERYFYDAEAIKETSITEDPRRPYTSEGAWQMDGRPAEQRHGGEIRSAYRQPNSPQSIKSPHGQGFTRRALGDKGEQAASAEVRASSGARRGRGAGWRDDPSTTPFTRNKRSVWTVATAPYSEAHFATFPPALIEPCILAGTSEKGVCAKCGAPWVRETERIDKGFDGSKYGERAVAASGGAKTGGTARSTLGSGNGRLTGGSETVGWSPSCSCNAATVPATVLDPFGGAGTTGLVADRLGRNAILIELNPAYAEMARRRIHGDCPLLTEVA